MRRAAVREPLRAVLATALALTLAALPAAARAGEPAYVTKQLSASEGTIGAVFSYREGLGGPLPIYDLHLQITRQGETFYEQPVSSAHCPGGCVPAPLGDAPVSGSTLAVRSLEGNGQPDVVLGLSTGGAHCCTVVQVFAYDPGTMTYGLAEHDFGDPGALLTDLDANGGLEFESADDRFAYEFAPYAYSGLPLQIWSFGEGRFHNTTASYPSAVRADAARWLHAFLLNRRKGLGLGFIAAWAADEELLGDGALVRSTLAREARAHRLRSFGHDAPTGEAFVRALVRFLKRTGYG